ncbi:hypothetical protein [Agathobacter rectalis]|uniref:hypothetical protein n=1 Tax=Agathobacter rectalis TaxID=39491 RepID=UPI0027F69E88|nr:hypothetical protein [Agathobacter rectalis]
MIPFDPLIILYFRPEYDLLVCESGFIYDGFYVTVYTKYFVVNWILRVTYYECHTMSVVVNISQVVFYVNRDLKNKWKKYRL